MLRSIMPLYQLRATVCVILCIGFFRLGCTSNQEGDDADDMALMGAHDFADLEMCEEPPPPMNAELHCSKHKTRKNKYVCKAECEAGFQFPNGKKKGRHLCDLKSGKWSPSYVFPDCIPICTPSCENNGECSEGNHCICTPDYRGDRCQYDLALCDAVKGFDVSGDWSCNHTSTDTKCILNCPPGTRYESQPADLYTCTLDGIWNPSIAPKCIPINIIEPPVSNSLYSISNAVKSNRLSSGVCATWSTTHYRTFDGGIYSFQGSSCAYLLAKDCQQNTFSIHLQNGDWCGSASTCGTTVTIYIGSEEYLLLNREEGPTVRNEGEYHPIPAAVDGLLFQMLSDYVTVSSPLGFKLKWNRKNTVLLEISSLLKNKTCGLCGKFDGSVLNDFETSDGTITDSIEVFANSWAMSLIGEPCEGKGVITDSCSESKEKSSKADERCRTIFSDRFSSCHSIVDPNTYYETCKMDYCSCGSSDGSCFCNSLAEYFRECFRLGGKVEGSWRNEKLCPLSCPEGMIYQDCGSACPRTCKGTVYDCEDSHCIDGCHCPENQVLHNGRCVERMSCPCLHNGIEHQNGDRILQDCNACECTGGKWKCTEETCEARCSSTGDPHFTTFDGLSYEFLGSCPYYLVYHDNFTIVQESGPCSSETSSEPASDSMYCTQAIKIDYGGGSLLLQPGIRVTLNDKLKDLPMSELGFSASMVTDLFLKVRLENQINVLWDGHNRIYIDIPPTMFDQTMGLCGTFNHNQNDDFLTPEKDIEADVNAFAARWQASDSCHKRSRRSSRRPNEMQPQKIADAEMLCSVLKSGTFSACHGEVDLEPFYKSCVNDLCLCGGQLEECLCPILADYSLSCTRKGVILNWVEDILSCKPDCSGGQVYKECGNPCTCTCDAIASEDDCRVQCVQGCTCPDGMTMNNEGFCVAIDQCPCLYNGKEYSAGVVTAQGLNICTCLNAKWQCQLGKLEKLKTIPPDSHRNITQLIQCSNENHEEFTDCMETCPRTCQNAHLPPKCRTEDCKPGCRCKEGFLFDEDLKKCIDFNQCGCMHANQRYDEGDTMKQYCNLCTCKAGQWQCSEKLCPGVCTAWGESHFKSYDGKIFDFQGDCEYILSKGKMKGASFTLSVQNVPCGTSGITCSKSFTLDLGPIKTDRGDMEEVIATEEKLTITRGENLPKMPLNSRFVVLESGMFVVIYTDAGISLRWDKGTRIYVTLDPKWRNRVKGLCGNFNDDQADDFLTPFGGIPEARASIFADSWKVYEFCPEPKAIEDTCNLHPHRKGWAQQKCGILKSDVFTACRAAVVVDAFYERCVFDSCACDMGGDCDCLCTAVAAYAQECSIHGVPVKWRSQEFCPIQCEECSNYNSCIPPCPKKTCENEFKYTKFQNICSEEFCVEGCDPKPCPEGQIYNNEKEYKCIPKVDCIVPCLEVNGVMYNEGDRVTDSEIADPCQSCHCRRGSINCVGNPCVKIEPVRPCLQSGWTPWKNTLSFVGGDYEELSKPALKATYEKFCGTGNMTKIECRKPGPTSVKKTGQSVACELPLRLTCTENEQGRKICEDYEIRVFCDCGEVATVETTTTLQPTTTAPRLPPVCEQTGWTPWMSSHLPDDEGESETLDGLRINHYFCAEHEIQDIECRTSLTWRYASSGDKDVVCNKKLGLVCKGPHCRDHEVRLYCKCGEEETTPVAPSCVTGWSEFFNTDHPDRSETGDEESLERVRASHQFCTGGTIEDIECKTVVNDQLVDYSTLDTFGLKCSKNVGFICNKYVRTEKCPDFMMRFYCVCEEAVETTPRPTTLAATTTTPLPLTYVPVECGWTPWLNIDTPEAGAEDDGDIEDLAKIQFIYKTCGGKDLVDIECRMSRTHHAYSESLQKNLQCDKFHGFRCQNSDQVGKCYDYEVRLLCMYDWCYPPTTTVQTTNVPSTTENPCPTGQVYDKCAYNCEQMCSSFVYEMAAKCSVSEGGCIAGCRPDVDCKFPNVYRDYYTCVSKDECTCAMLEKNETTVLAPNEVIVRDCEKCQCVHDDLKCFTIYGCGTTPDLVAEPRIYIQNILKEDCWTEWVNIDSPKSEGGDLEVLNSIRTHYKFCPDPVKIECRTAESKQKPFDVGQVVTCDLQTGLVCWNNDNKPEDCYDYEIRFFCPCATTALPTSPTPIPTLAPGACLFGWTEWYNSHRPDNRGDYETIQSARVQNIFCSNDMISAVQCRRVGSNDIGALQHGVICDLEFGLVCSQDYLGEDESCWDYETRWFCDCPTMAPFTETETTPPTTTKLPAQFACSYWSEWINENHPGNRGGSTKKGVKGGTSVVRYDNEKAMPLKLQREQHFCLEGTISDIECREAETDTDYYETGSNLVCSLVSGFRCRGKDQPGGMCKDYKIRYFCSCNEITTPRVITKLTVPTVYIEPCTEFYSVVDGPYPLPDSSLKASSSKYAESGPQSARLSTTANSKSAGSWISAEISDHEFIEIDLGSIQPVYGVVTKGRNGHQEWVKSYKILYSRNGISYAYVVDKANQEQVFSGNSDSDSRVEHVFSKPFEARFVRIQPITYHKEIAMRVDLLACAEGMSTVPILTTQPPPCTDDMGLVDGAIADYQIKTSSDRNENTDGRFVRLNLTQTEYNSGGWVAADLDGNQFVQVDFIEPRVLTGVKIQGRDTVPQWVTSFAVSYSSDGISWNDLLDISGTSRKIFTGNYDSDSISTAYFPQPIRTRFIRIIPVSWNNWISMRLEILGCYERYQELVKDKYHTTAAPIMLETCAETMGFENHQFPSTLITVSSSESPASDKSRIRLNTPSDSRGTGGWIPAAYDYKPVVFIDFFEERNLSGIITQGLEDMDKWVMSYYVRYSLDNITWEKAYDKETGNMVFAGNLDRNSPVLRLFSSVILTRYLKIIIVDYHTGPALRMEILGCFIPYDITPPPPMLMTTTEFCVKAGPWISLSDPATQDYGDVEPIDKIISASGTCTNPYEIQCRSMVTLKDYSETGQSVICDLEHGLRCINREQSPYPCYNYEVRLKCWTCGMETTTAPYPLELCPEIPEFMKESCPTTCPKDYVCDGYGCVPRIDCPCFKEDKRFQPSNIIVTGDCKRCDCILGGYSNCKPIECSTCLPGQKSQLDEHCTCQCVGCSEGTLLCPSSGECINETQWCDGKVDCPDDEVGCPTTIRETTTTVAPTTTQLPVVCPIEYGAETDTCDLTANLFDTFDGVHYQYDICDHILMMERTSNVYTVTIHKTCAPDSPNSCQRYLIIEQDGVVLKIGPSTDDITVQENRVSPANFYVVSKRFQDFELQKKGNSIVFRSKKYHFDVFWDSVQNAKIVLSQCLYNQVVGLCGLYNKNPADDRTTHDGKLATTNEEFGNSWSIGPSDRCTASTCPEDMMRMAISLCKPLQEEPFKSCEGFLKMESRVEACVVFMCECLQRSTLDARRKSSDTFDEIYHSGECKCLAYESFVEVCEAVKPEPVPEWRIQHECTPECPPGMEWQDCGPGCELTCDNYHERDTICRGGCTPGCYCPSGLIRHHDKCVKPKMCQDCVCRGHGDPNYITFDGRYYAFQGNCTYILAQHLTSEDKKINFKILATNVECPEEPHTSCTDGLQILWNGHTIEKFKNKPVYLDGDVLSGNDSPLEKDGISITFVPGKSTIIHIKSINLAVRYFDQMYGFNIELPAFYYFNKTEGLCGVCNFIQSDDIYHRDGYITDDIEDFAYSWLAEPERREHCEFPRVVAPEPPPGICNFTISPCETFLDPSLYSQSCQNDVTYSHKPEASMCRSKFQYAQQCCERGISLMEWLKASGCEYSCPEGMHFECTSACPKTCDNYKNYHVEDCDLMPLYTCHCPEGQILQLGSCVEERLCEVCDSLGHVVGDVWNVGPCEQCECLVDLSTRCTITECPKPPVCKEKEKLEKIESNTTACCEVYQCVEEVAEMSCPEAKLQDCGKGEANVITYVDGCPVYHCKCMPDLCPPLLEPLLDEGELSSIESESCCPYYSTKCHPEKCSLPPQCNKGFKLSIYEGKCCLKYTCIPRKDVCVYQYKYDVLNGTQINLSPEEYYEMEYEAGSSWQDGLCRKCSCIEIEGQYAFSCKEEICPNPEDFPDAEKYERETIHVPGSCCPKYRRTACKLNGVPYSIDSEWPSPDGDNCKSFKCVKERGEAAILEKTTVCDKKCPDYAKYVEPSQHSKKCCGECKAVACEENGILYEDGSTWMSTIKSCYKAECSVTDNGTRIVYQGESCPPMPDNCPVENVKIDPKGCCSYCKQSSESCSAVQVPLYESRGFFGYVDSVKGFCSNEDALEDLTKCAGQCSADSQYSNLIGDFESLCNCCLPLRTEHRLIILNCEDGSKVEKVYQQPLSCQCSNCSGRNDRSLESMNKIEQV